MLLGTFALIHVLSHPRPNEAVARVNAFLRGMLHSRPRRGRYIKKK